MEVIIPATSGFCPGVKNAERRVFEIKTRRPDRTLYVNGFLINNKRYIDFLDKNGVFMVDDLSHIPDQAAVFIRTHGIDQKEEEQLRAQFEVIDLTCVNVKKIQQEIARHARNGCHTVITGRKNHPEIRGLVSYAQGRFSVIETDEDLEKLTNGDKPLTGNIFLCSQTTGSRPLFSKVRQRLETLCGTESAARLFVYDSICPVTEKKEEEALLVQKAVDASFVVGDKLSSNAKKLHQRLASVKQAVYFVEDLEELISLKLPLKSFHKTLVVSSASTPGFVESEIVAYLSSIHPE